jgi:hypothetical protein
MQGGEQQRDLQLALPLASQTAIIHGTIQRAEQDANKSQTVRGFANEFVKRLTSIFFLVPSQAFVPFLIASAKSLLARFRKNKKMATLLVTLLGLISVYGTPAQFEYVLRYAVSHFGAGSLPYDLQMNLLSAELSCVNKQKKWHCARNPPRKGYILAKPQQRSWKNDAKAWWDASTHLPDALQTWIIDTQLMEIFGQLFTSLYVGPGLIWILKYAYGLNAAQKAFDYWSPQWTRKAQQLSECTQLYSKNPRDNDGRRSFDKTQSNRSARSNIRDIQYNVNREIDYVRLQIQSDPNVDMTSLFQQAENRMNESLNKVPDECKNLGQQTQQVRHKPALFQSHFNREHDIQMGAPGESDAQLGWPGAQGEPPPRGPDSSKRPRAPSPDQNPAKRPRSESHERRTKRKRPPQLKQSQQPINPNGQNFNNQTRHI